MVFPQGVRGYRRDLVRPPCGWSIGFIATPRTIDLNPYVRQKPPLVFRKSRFSRAAALPGTTKPNKETTFRTPEGRYATAVYVVLSLFVIRPQEPELRAY